MTISPPQSDRCSSKELRLRRGDGLFLSGECCFGGNFSMNLYLCLYNIELGCVMSISFDNSLLTFTKVIPQRTLHIHPTIIGAVINCRKAASRLISEDFLFESCSVLQPQIMPRTLRRVPDPGMSTFSKQKITARGIGRWGMAFLKYPCFSRILTTSTKPRLVSATVVDVGGTIEADLRNALAGTAPNRMLGSVESEALGHWHVSGDRLLAFSGLFGLPQNPHRSTSEVSISFDWIFSFSTWSILSFVDFYYSHIYIFSQYMFLLYFQNSFSPLFD